MQLGPRVVRVRPLPVTDLSNSTFNFGQIVKFLRFAPNCPVKNPLLGSQRNSSLFHTWACMMLSTFRCSRGLPRMVIIQQQSIFFSFLHANLTCVLTHAHYTQGVSENTHTDWVIHRVFQKTVHTSLSSWNNSDVISHMWKAGLTWQSWKFMLNQQGENQKWDFPILFHFFSVCGRGNHPPHHAQAGPCSKQGHIYFMDGQ
jgi:hypothetical protein